MPDKIDLAYALTLAPEAAIAYFRAKGYAITWSWRDLWQEAQAKAFTVAGVMKMEVLQEIRGAVDKALSKGQTYADFARQLTPALQRMGWWGKGAQIDPATGEMAGKALMPWRLRVIYQTNLQTAYMAGRFKGQMDNVSDRPFWQYTAVMDRRTRPTHSAMNGLIFRSDDPFWDSFYPPNGFNCRCRVRALDSDNMQERGLLLSSSQGKLSEIKIPAGKGADAPMVSVARFETAPRRFITPDAGWSYNPGKAAWSPDLSRYPADLVRQYRGAQP
jgi:SPP1 gp7 family putative phage head morphogenesis protein